MPEFSRESGLHESTPQIAEIPREGWRVPGNPRADPRGIASDTRGQGIIAQGISAKTRGTKLSGQGPRRRRAWKRHRDVGESTSHAGDLG